MPSSTFSSSAYPRPPVICYGRVFLLAAVLVVAFFCLAEFLLRERGYRPSVADSKRLWAIRRGAVYDSDGRERVVIVGSSRAQVGIVPDVIEESWPGVKVIMLAIDGTAGTAVIEDLCRDERFRGTILADAQAWHFLPQAQSSGSEWVAEYYRSRPPLLLDSTLNEMLSVWVQSHLVLMSPHLGLKNLVSKCFRIAPMYIHMLANRYRPAHYMSRMTEEQRLEHRVCRVSREQSVLGCITNDMRVLTKFFERSVMRQLTPSYEKLHARGGRLVFVQMPTTDETLDMYRTQFPRQLFWDRITEYSGIPSVHFMDDEALSRYPCPDTSHLDAADAPEFTRALVSSVQEAISR